MAVIIEETNQENILIPTSGNYKPSMFSNIISGFSLFLIFLIFITTLWGIVSTFITLSEFSQAAQQGFPQNPSRLNPDGTPAINSNDSIETIDFGFWMRWSFAGYISAFSLYYPTKWLIKTYGRQSLTINDAGLTLKKFLTPRYSVPWTGVIDVSVKESESIFAVFSNNISKITIYTMDRAMSFETITLTNSGELTQRLRDFGESLEERVIDFGYGAQLAVVWRRLKRTKVGVLGLILVVFWTGVSILAVAVIIVNPVNDLNAAIEQKTLFGFWNPNYVNINVKDSPPSFDYFFGTDYLGRDIFSRVFFGSFYSILIGVISTFISVLIGAFVGAASGYIGGTIDQITQRITEILIAMPGLPILLLVSAAFTPLFQRIDLEGAYYLVVFSIFSLIGWGGTARIVRAEVLSLKQSEFIQAELVLGATHYRIITKHIMPNAFSTVIIFFTLGIAGAIVSVASLAYLGFGSQSTLVWGSDLNSAIQNYPTKFWWGTTFISLCLFTLVLGFNLLGDALRDALDPRLKE